MGIAVLLISLLVTSVTASLIARALSRPVDELARVAEAVSQSRDYRVRAKRLTGGELGLDRTVHGPKWMYRDARARVISLESQEVIPEVYQPAIKPYGVSRSRTRDQWRLASESDLVPA